MLNPDNGDVASEKPALWKECALCGRPSRKLHGHHLVPRKFLRSGSAREYVLKYRENAGRRVQLCVDCNKMVHAMHKLKELAKNYDTIEKLRDSPKLQDYVRWVQTRQVGVIRHPVRSWKGGRYE